MGGLKRIALVVVLAGAGFAMSYTIASRPAEPPRAAPSTVDGRSTAGPRSEPGRGTTRLYSDVVESPPQDLGVALYLEVNAEYPEEGKRTWAAIDRATSKAAMQLVAAHGYPSVHCGTDGRLDDAILMVHWAVSTRHGRVSVAGGRAVDADLDEELRRCLDDYLALATMEFPAEDEIVELDILVEEPLPASPS